MPKIESFISKYNWKRTNISSGKDGWETFDKNTSKYIYIYLYIFVIPSKDAKILEFNQYWQSDKIPSIIYADLESLIKEKDRCENNSEKSSAAKIDEHIQIFNVYDIDV